MKLIDVDAAIHALSVASRGDSKDVIRNLVIRFLLALPTVDAVPIQYILTTIREWNRDGYAESAEALEILVMNWDKENTEWVERKDNETD